MSTTEPTIFRRIISGDDVEQWCLALCKRWTSTYLAEKERQDGLQPGQTQRPRSYQVAASLDKMPEDQLPAIVIVSIGLGEAPRKEGDGTYSGRWDMGLAVVCAARSQADAHAMSRRYIAALRALFVQRPSLDGHAAGLTWQAERYGDDLDYDDSRSLSASVAQFTVEVRDITCANAGPTTPNEPLDPDTDPWADWPEVKTYDVDVENVEEVTQP